MTDVKKKIDFDKIKKKRCAHLIFFDFIYFYNELNAQKF